MIVYSDFIMAKCFTQASKPFCSLKIFPHLTLHLLSRPLRNWYEEHVGFKVVQNRNFKFFNVEEGYDYEEVLKASVSSDPLERKATFMISKMIEDDPKGFKWASYKFFHYKFDYTINSVYCKYQILHLIDSNVSVCNPKKCKHKHMNKFLLSTIIGYLTFDFKGHESIFGCIHCFYNYEFGYNVLWLNVLDDFYDRFEENSFEHCIIKRFNDDVMPALFPIMSDREFDEYDELILELCDCVGDESDYFDELIFVMFEQYQDEEENQNEDQNKDQNKDKTQY